MSLSLLFSRSTWLESAVMVFCISSSEPSDAVFFAAGGVASGLCVGSAGASAVLMIFTSLVAGAAVSVGAAIGGFVITGLGATGLVAVRRVRFLLRSEERRVGKEGRSR